MAELRFLLDTNIHVLVLDGGSAELRPRIEACEFGSLVTSTIVLAEIFRAVGPDDRHTRDRLAALLALAPALPFDAEAARCYAALPFCRARFDGLIAAHALASSLTVVTANPGDFADVPGLAVEDWTR